MLSWRMMSSWTKAVAEAVRAWRAKKERLDHTLVSIERLDRSRTMMGMSGY